MPVKAELRIVLPKSSLGAAIGYALERKTPGKFLDDPRIPIDILPETLRAGGCCTIVLRLFSIFVGLSSYLESIAVFSAYHVFNEFGFIFAD